MPVSSENKSDHHRGAVRLDLTLPGTTASITPVVETVLAVIRETRCVEGKEFEIETAVREALANAIMHGCGNDACKQVRCCVLCDQERGLLIVVRDPGQGFDPDKIPDPTSSESLYSGHGRGIYLINQLMDEVRFDRNGSEIHMRKH
jgi:serine/threonine-protein kinase RsbW